MGVWNKPFHVFLFLHCMYIAVKEYFEYNAQYHRVFSDTVSWYDLRNEDIFKILSTNHYTRFAHDWVMSIEYSGYVIVTAYTGYI